MKYTAVIGLLLVAFMLQARGPIVGHVTDAEEGIPLGAVSVRIIDSKGKIRKFATGGPTGVFSINVPEGDSLTLQLAKMSYKTMEYGLDTLDFADTLRVAMPVNAVRLAEVGVRAKRIRENGDTVTYTVGEFTRKQDRSIGEVMNRMPGLEVSNSGNVKYQGTDINKLYVEGTDIAGSNHGLVTKNVQASDVKAVEVLENHQPLQVLRGLSFSDQAAVNLRLKDAAKTNVTAHGNGGVGYGGHTGMLYTGELFAMTFKSNVQNMTSLKTNNTGNPLGSGAGTGGWDNTGENLYEYISIGGVAGNGNTLFNHSVSFDTSTTWKNRHGGQWRLQAEYGFDRLWADRSTITTYYLPDGSDRVITEQRHALSNSHTCNFIANYEVNQKTYFLNNNFAFSGAWSDTDIDIVGTMSNRQRASTPAYDAANRLKVIKRFGERHMVTFNSTNQWLYKPHTLSVALGGSDGSEVAYGSRARQNAFFTDERASYGFIVGRLLVSVEGGLAGFIRHLDSDITGQVELPDIDLSNDLSTNYFRLFAKPKVELNLRRVSFKLSLPLNYYYYFFGGALPDRNELFFSPTLDAQWKPNSRHTINFSASSRRSPASLGQILHGDVLADYRTFNAGIDDYYASTGQNLTTRWEWRNALHGLFATAYASQSWNKMKSGVAQMLIGDYVFNYYRAEPSQSESTTILADITKSIDPINSSIRLQGGFNRGTSEIISQDVPLHRTTRRWTASAHVDARITSWLNADYSFNFVTNTLALRQISSNRVDNYTHSLNLAFTPGKWVLNISGRHNRDRIEPHRYMNRVDLNSYLRYNISHHFDISLHAHNLLDKRVWVNRSFSEAGSVETLSWQRGRQFLVTIHIIK